MSMSKGLLSVSLVGILASAAAADQPAALGLYLRAGTVDTSIPAPLAGALSLARATPIVIQLDGPTTPDRRARLAAAGVTLGEYLPDNAYIATLTSATAQSVAPLQFVRWWSAYQSAWKLDPEIGQRTYTTGPRLALARQGRDQLLVTLFPGADAAATERAIWAVRGAAVLDENQVGNRWEFLIEASPAQCSKVALIPGVQYIEPAPEATPRSNLTTRWIVQSNQTNVFPCYANGIHGENQVIGIIDQQIDQNHCSFQDTSHPIGPTHRKLVAYNGAAGAQLHGTHVGGIAAGDAGAETNTRGVAYLAKIAYGGSYNSALSESGFITEATFDHTAGARIHTNSWGNDGTTSYDGVCRGIDRFTYDNEDDMVCFAVSNGSVITNPENAKNVLAVGNDGDTPQQGTFCTGGTGPTADGRRKPEIWAPGCNTDSSLAGSGCGTTQLTGTSMASPAIAGVGALVRQYYTDGYYPTGATGGTSLTPSGALIRATILNSGADMSGGAGYPGVREGWGRVLIDNALYFAGDARKLFVSDVRNAQGLSTGGETDVNVNVAGSAQQLRITLVWTEPAATAGVSNPVINNLDLQVTDPNGQTYLGNVFNTSTGNSQTGGAADAKNNVEQVHVTNPPTGQWTISIKGTAVGVGTQGYALVVTGDLGSGQQPCYANCDGSTTQPVLNVNDFICFQSAFAAGQSYANCDNSTTPPVLNVNDFICFQSQFAQGCP